MAKQRHNSGIEGQIHRYAKNLYIYKRGKSRAHKSDMADQRPDYPQYDTGCGTDGGDGNLPWRIGLWLRTGT